MRCLVCKSFSFSVICVSCQENLLSPSFYTRELPDGFKVHSFYKYSEISFLLKTKHKFIGNRVYKILAQRSFAKFAKDFKYEEKIYSLSIDDDIETGYSHTAILNKSLRSKIIRPLYAKIIATNRVKYSGKSLEYRLSHPRGFKIVLQGRFNVILVDDIVTTSTTILEAKNRLVKVGHNPLFALCLADAKEY